MKPRRKSAAHATLSALLSFATITTIAVAQQPQPRRAPPHLGYAYPAGGQHGTTFTVVVGGQALNGATAADFTGSGVQARVTGYQRPLTPKEFNALREQMQQLQEKRKAAMQPAVTAEETTAPRPVWTPEDAKLAAELRRKMANRPNRQANPALAETVTLEVAIAPGAAIGTRELRVQAANGLSNPIAFCIGELPEFAQPAASSTPPAPPAGPGRPRNDGAARPPAAPTTITLPAVANGQIMPGEVDRFRFRARQGQRLVVVVQARALIPYLADAVPGWFQATAALLDADGRELAYADDFRFNPDPALCFEIPRDGEYVVAIKDAIFRGREDFVYRLAIGEVPFITSIFPLGGRCGQKTAVAVDGWNLPATRAVVNATELRRALSWLTVSRDGIASNPVPFALDDLDAIAEAQPNDTIPEAQGLVLPAVIDGRIDRPGDADIFRFEARAGEPIVAEVFARRLGSPLDAVLELTDLAGQRLAFNDDHEDKAAGLITHHADARVEFTAPGDGDYFIRLTDAERHGTSDRGYRLHIGPPRPDFDLRVVPASLNLRAGGSTTFTVHVLRKDGFDGEIVLVLRNAPPGFALRDARVVANQDKAEVTLTAPMLTGEFSFNLAIEGRATIDGRKVAHHAVPAEDMMQAFAYRHLVPAQTLVVEVLPPRRRNIVGVP